MKEPFEKLDLEFLRLNRFTSIWTLKELSDNFPSENFEELRREVGKISFEYSNLKETIIKKIQNYNELPTSYKFDSEICLLIKTALKNQDVVSEKIYLTVQKHNFSESLRKQYGHSKSHTLALEYGTSKNNLII